MVEKRKLIAFDAEKMKETDIWNNRIPRIIQWASSNKNRIRKGDTFEMSSAINFKMMGIMVFRQIAWEY